MTNKKIAVIGAGAAGLTAIKSCLEENLQVKCFEQTASFGGLWRYREEVIEGQGSVMKSTTINTSKELSAFSDFPPPAELPVFMHNRDLLKYFEMYSEHFDLLKHILFHREVLQISRSEDYSQTGRWQIKVRDLLNHIDYEDIFDGVMICTGHHGFPNHVKYPGTDKFHGDVIHSHSYRTPKGYEDKNVLVIGMGNSAIDVAVELGSIAKKVYLSTHRGAWVFPRRWLRGWPADYFVTRRSNAFLFQLFPKLITKAMEIAANFFFDHDLYGLKPKHSLLNQHPTLNDLLGTSIASGTVVMKSDVKHFKKVGVVFEGEESKEYSVDAVILGTGYVYKYPFLEERIFKMIEGRSELYKFIFPPEMEHPSLAFIGMLDPFGAAFPVFEMQSRFAVQIMLQKVGMPSKDVMLLDIEKKASLNRNIFSVGKRHATPTSIFPTYFMDELANLMGIKPDLLKLMFTDIKLFWFCLFGPLVAYQYRLQGLHSWSGAREAILSVTKRMSAPFETRHTTPGKHREWKIEGTLFLFMSLVFLYFLL